MIYFPVDITIQIGPDGRHEETVQDFVDLYRALENCRLDASVKRRYAHSALVSIHIDGYASPVEFVLGDVQRSIFVNGYGINDIERLVTDAIETQQMFRHLSAEPQDYNTIWEELL